MKVLLNVSIARYLNGSFKSFAQGEIVDLPLDEAKRMIELGRASRIEETEPEVKVQPALKTKPVNKRGA